MHRERIAREKAAKRKERAEMKAALAVAKQAEREEEEKQKRAEKRARQAVRFQTRIPQSRRATQPRVAVLVQNYSVPRWLSCGLFDRLQR